MTSSRGGGTLGLGALSGSFDLPYDDQGMESVSDKETEGTNLLVSSAASAPRSGPVPGDWKTLWPEARGFSHVQGTELVTKPSAFSVEMQPLPAGYIQMGMRA